jgi:1-acyl-sn-glycerol-3-phosphate acyltransferase
VVYEISKWIVRLALRALCGFRVDGGDREPPSGPLVIVSNHVSDLDPLVVGVALRRRVHFMAKVELFRPPLLRWWIRACGAFPVRRGEVDRQAFRTARTILEHGEALVMFPEGTRASSLDDLRPPEPGAALLAVRTGAAILPVAVIGTDRVLPRGARRPARGTIRVRIGDAIHINGAASRIAAGRVERERVESVGRRFMGEIGRMLKGADTT